MELGSNSDSAVFGSQALRWRRKSFSTSARGARKKFSIQPRSAVASVAYELKYWPTLMLPMRLSGACWSLPPGPAIVLDGGARWDRGSLAVLSSAPTSRAVSGSPTPGWRGLTR
eukprot:8184153-Alexandrium_andersonii.AAC.1